METSNIEYCIVCTKKRIYNSDFWYGKIWNSSKVDALDSSGQKQAITIILLDMDIHTAKTGHHYDFIRYGSVRYGRRFHDNIYSFGYVGPHEIVVND